jgi:hypothetical protein
MMDAIKNAVEAEIKRRERVLDDPAGMNMIIDQTTKKPRSARLSEIKPDYTGVMNAVAAALHDTTREIRASSVAMAAGFAGKSAKDIIREADLLADFVLNGKAKPEEKSNG